MATRKARICIMLTAEEDHFIRKQVEKVLDGIVEVPDSSGLGSASDIGRSLLLRWAEVIDDAGKIDEVA